MKLAYKNKKKLSPTIFLKYPMKLNSIPKNGPKYEENLNY
jgi:hypothetical protein